MKRTIVRLLVALLLIGTLVGMLVACGGTKEVTVTVMDGDKAIKTITLEKGAKLDIKPSDITKEGGYECTGIYTDAEMTEALGKDVTVEEDMTLYAAFRLKTLYLFAQGDPDADEERISVTAGGSYTLPTPTREGYRFLGYFYGSEPFAQSGTYTYTDSITVKAKWQKIVYLNVSDGTTTTKVEVAADGSFVLDNKANTATHTFAGYKNGTAAFGTFDAASGKWIGTYEGKNDLFITENWVAIPTYTLTVNGLGATPTVLTYKTGDTYTLPTAPERDGYTFLGYKRGTDAFAATGTFSFSENIAVEAVWQKIPTVTVMNGNTQISSFRLPANGSFALPAVADTADNRFLGYLGDTGFTAVWNETTEEYDCTYTGTADLTVRYNWEGIRYIVFQSIAGHNVTSIEIVPGTDTYTLPTPADSATHYFMGIKKGNDLLTGTSYTLTGDELTGDEDVVLTAVWQQKTYVTVFDGQSAVGEPVLIGKDGTVTLPKQNDVTGKLFAGYTMTGVTFTKNGDGSYTATGLTAGGTAFISWYVLPTVSFDTNGGVAISNTVTLAVGQNTLPIPTRDGYTFAGWQLGTADFTGANGLYTLAAGTYESGTTLRLVAKWRSNDAEGEVVGQNYFKEYDEASAEYEYIFLTGTTNVYTFSGYTLSFQNNNGVVTAKTDNSFVANKPGSFRMVLTSTTDGTSRTVSCRVENRINSFEIGKNTDASYQANFKNGIDGVLDAGMQNLVPHILVEGFTNNAAATLPLSNIPMSITLEYWEDDEYLPYTADGYTLQGGALTFTDGLLLGKQVRVTLSPKYALKDNKASQTKVFEYLLNDGVNVYTDAELYENFKNTAIKTINIQRDITAKLHESECACSKDLVAKCTGDHKYPLNDWGYGAYVRNLDTTVPETFTLNGNCYKLDGSTLPLVDPRNPGASYGGGFSGQGDADNDANGLAYKTANVQTAILSYYSPKGNDATGAQTLVVNDLYLAGSNTKSPDYSVGVNGSTDDKEKILVASMTFYGITTRRANLTATNMTVQNTHGAIFNAGYEEMSPNRLTTTILLDGVILDNSFENHIYNWGQVGVTVKNSALKQTSGAAILFEDSPLAYTEKNGENVASYLSIDKATTVENYVLGTEPWFNAYGMVTAAGAIKTMIPQLIGATLGALDATFGAPVGSMLPDITPSSAVKETDKGQVFNLVCVIKEGRGENDEWKQDKEYVALGTDRNPLSFTRGRAHVRIIPADGSTFMPLDASAMNGALVPYACFDSKLYVNYSLPAFGSAGVILGLSE